jgi:hypothetical protein
LEQALMNNSLITAIVSAAISIAVPPAIAAEPKETLK